MANEIKWEPTKEQQEVIDMINSAGLKTEKGKDIAFYGKSEATYNKFVEKYAEPAKAKLAEQEKENAEKGKKERHSIVFASAVTEKTNKNGKPYYEVHVPVVDEKGEPVMTKGKDGKEKQLNQVYLTNTGVLTPYKLDEKGRVTSYAYRGHGKDANVTVQKRDGYDAEKKQWNYKEVPVKEMASALIASKAQVYAFTKEGGYREQINSTKKALEARAIEKEGRVR